MQGPTVRAMSLSELRNAVSMTVPRGNSGRSLPRSSSVDEIGARQMMKHQLEVQTSYETRLAQKVLPSLTPTIIPNPNHNPNHNPNMKPGKKLTYDDENYDLTKIFAGPQVELKRWYGRDHPRNEKGKTITLDLRRRENMKKFKTN